MSIRVLVDQCVPMSVAHKLRDAGCDVTLLRDHLPIDAPDDQVIEKAQQLDAVLLSVNGDFADLISYPPHQYGGIIGLQIANHPSAVRPIVDRLIAHLKTNSDRNFYRGKLLIVEPHRIRMRQ